MIVVATENFELYHDLIAELRQRDATFTTIDPGEPFPPETRAVITGTQDTITNAEDHPVFEATPETVRHTVEAVVSELSNARGRTVIGVDPGDRPGIAILQGNEIVSTFHEPLEQAIERIQAEIAATDDPLVRIGDGARLTGAKIINEISDADIELVDETGTTPHLGAGVRGVGDVLAAVNIASRSGTPISNRAVEPSPGELSVIQDESRERANDNREIDLALARRVAKGEIDIDEALSIHREKT